MLRVGCEVDLGSGMVGRGAFSEAGLPFCMGSPWGPDAAPSPWLTAEREEMWLVRLPVDHMAPVR